MQPAGLDPDDRQRKMPRIEQRPSTASGAPNSSSSSGIWRTGTAPSRQGQQEQQMPGQMMRRPLTATGRQGEGTSLSSMLRGNNENDSGNTANTQPSRYQDPDPQQSKPQGYMRGTPLNTPSVAGKTPGFNPQTPNPPSSTSGMQRPMNWGGPERPLTPSTLFLPNNNQQSQHFQNQQQQHRQQQVLQQVSTCILK